MPILTPDDGLVAKTPDEAQMLQAAGYQQCYGSKNSNAGPQKGQNCDFYIAPEAQSFVQDKGGYYTCPRCKQSHDLMHDLPWHGAQEGEFNRDDFSAGGGTKIGLSLKEQGQIGEDLVSSLPDLPGYGPITWRSNTYNSPLDMATQDWGIEVKTLGYDAIHHRFIPGRPKEKAEKNEMAAAKGYKGVLGVLVILNYRNSKADIFVREYPVDLAAGQGVGAFRSTGSQHLVAEIPFDNPFMDPAHPAPTTANATGPVDVTGEAMSF